MAITLDGTTGITTPGLTNTGTETIVNLTTTGNTILGNASTDTLNVGNGDLVKDASGNVGVGVTPNTWSQGKAIELGISGVGLWQIDSGSFATIQNTYYNTGWKYASTAPATYYVQTSGQHQWFNAPSGTAGNAITFTQAMQIANSGGVSIGNTTDPGATNLSVTGVINGATLFGQGIGISNGGSQTVTCPRSFDTRGAQIFIGGLVQGVGGRAGLYITTGYGNGVTTISAFAGLTVTCNTSAGTITIANASGATVDGRVTVTY